MDWIAPALRQLEHRDGWGYIPGSAPASEPVALAALALAGHGQSAKAAPAFEWLAERQAADGSVGISAAESAPHWPTSLAILAWCTAIAARGNQGNAWRDRAELAVSWLLRIEGTSMPQAPEIGHDTTLIGWPWVEETHSWLEPTAWALLALKATGNAEHARARQAVRLLYDRILPTGGCNYGNTLVFGQPLRPHLAPSGLALLALAGEADPEGRIARTLTYVRGAVGLETTAVSLANGLLGLAAHDQLPKNHADWLVSAVQRTRVRGASLPRVTSLLLAALGRKCPLITLTRRSDVA